MNSLATLQTETPNAKTYRAFNTLGWENFAEPVIDGVQADLFFCGPRATMEQLISDIGLRPVWIGNNDQIAIIDGLLRLWFALAIGQGKGRHLAFKMITR